MALFDGHGDNGHFVSNFAMSCMLDYIKNAKVLGGKTFMQVSDNVSDQEVTKLLKNAFKYTQDKLRDWYEEFLKEKSKVKLQEEFRKQELEELEKMKELAKQKEKNKFREQPIKKSSSNTIRSINVDGNKIFKKAKDKCVKDIEIDPIEREFIDNVSWDTNSQEFNKSNEEFDNLSIDSDYANLYNPQLNTFKMEYINETKPYKIIGREK